MARKCYVGFWPWPRVWTTLEAYQLANSLKRDNSDIHLKDSLSEDQAEVFRHVSYEYITRDIELQICADGLFLYRCNNIEKDIIKASELDVQVSDPMIAGFDAIMKESSKAYQHYIPALNIIFALVESELHSNGRNSQIYWSQPIGRTEMIRVNIAQSESENSSLTNFGPVNEMQLQRFSGNLSIGARLDGHFHQEVVEAFKDACLIFEKAFFDSHLWSFLENYANAWSNFQTQLYESSLAISWSIIERDLVAQTSSLLNQLPAGAIYKLDSNSNIVPLPHREENRIRTKIAQGESPMVGILISILSGHHIPLSDHLQTVKQARNEHQHQGASVTAKHCREALMVCSEICKRKHSIELNCRLHANAHLGITC